MRIKMPSSANAVQLRQELDQRVQELTAKGRTAEAQGWSAITVEDLPPDTFVNVPDGVEIDRASVELFLQRHFSKVLALNLDTARDSFRAAGTQAQKNQAIDDFMTAMIKLLKARFNGG